MNESRDIAELPAIVVVAYHRPDSLFRLLTALKNAIFPEGEIALHISIDQSYSESVFQLAQNFAWPFGPKGLTRHAEPLGLRNHILFCADLSLRYGSIILLEDDLWVSPHFYNYACDALGEYGDSAPVAGISLYHYELAESTQMPFRPWSDDSDVYFMQWPSSWGQVWTRTQWLAFRNWWDARSEEEVDAILPQFVLGWEADSWKRLFIAFLIDTDQYFVFPRYSLSTHFGEPGVHTVQKGFQQSSLLGEKKLWKWKNYQDSNAVYDCFFEMKADRLKILQPALVSYDFDVDLFGGKESKWLENEFVLTSRSTPAELKDQAPMAFSMELLPLVQNIVHALPGQQIHLLENGPDFPETSSGRQTLSQLNGWTRLFSQGRQKGSVQSIGIVIAEHEFSPRAEATIRSVLAQQAVQFEIVLLVHRPQESSPDPRIKVLDWPQGYSYWQALELGFRACHADLLMWLHPGNLLCQQVLSRIDEVMDQYREVDALLLRPDPMSSLASQRWTKDRYAKASAGLLRASLGPACWVLRRELCLKAILGFENEYDLWNRLFGETLPLTLDLVGTSEVMPLEGLAWTKAEPEGRADLAASRSWLGAQLSRAMRPLFLTGSALGWLHMEMEHYPPVVRWDEAQQAWDMKRF